MDVYLKKHSLDLKVIPNRNMIKLSDLRSRSVISPLSSLELDKSCSKVEENIQEKDSKKDERPIKDEQKEEELHEEVDEDDEYEEEEEEDEVDEEEEEDDDDDENSEQINRKKMRKKREPSLKLQQKLTSQDLEMIVSSVKNKQARVFIADVAKTGYVDKILRIQLFKSEEKTEPDNKTNPPAHGLVLSNGRSEALLKKSMFGKELTTLFDAFVGALCGQESVRDERSGTLKPILKCLVECCGFRSISEAEINRHIKR